MQTKAVGRLALLASLLAAAVQPTHAGQDVRTLAQAYNTSGQALFQELALKPGNIVISPYSIGAAMAMARAGARGETERQMTNVLKHNLPLPASVAANAALLAILDRYAIRLQ